MTAQELSESQARKTSPKHRALQKREEFENGCKVKRSHCNHISVPVRLDMYELALAFSMQLCTSVRRTSSGSKGIRVGAACPSRATQRSAVLLSFLERHCWWLPSNFHLVKILSGDINTCSS